jgi:microcystin-dependent protein
MTFTPNKNIETPSHGSDVNTWDVNANSNFTIIDTCFSGTLLLNATGLSGTQALTQTQVQPPTIQISGTPTAAITYTVPSAIGGVWAVRNTTAGGFAVGVASAAGGATVAVGAGQSVHMWCDGTATGMIVVNAPAALTGVVVPFAGSTAPSGALICNGQAVSRTGFANLFSTIGTQYGAGDGSTTFNVPDLRGTVPAGMDVMGGSANANRLSTVISSTTLGATGGAQTYALQPAELAAHTHSVNITDNGHAHAMSGNYVNTNAVGSFISTLAFGGDQSIWQGGNTTVATSNISAGTGTTGSSSAHLNTQPTMVMNYIIFT